MRTDGAGLTCPVRYYGYAFVTCGPDWVAPNHVTD